MKKNNKSLKIAPFLFSIALILITAFFSENKLLSVKEKAYADNKTTHVSADSIQKTLTFRSSTQTSGLFSGPGRSITLPSNIQQGDLLIAVAGTNGPSTSWSVPSGWTQGQNSGSTDAQGINWWWKVADGSESGTSITLQSSSYADGGAVVNVYTGQTASPIVGVSSMTTNDNFGAGHVQSASVAGLSTDSTVTAVPLILASWQPNVTTVSFPNEFAFESAADDGYSFVAVGEGFSSLTTNSFPGYSLSLSSGQAVIQTLQILVRVQ